jgi:2,5-diketo-D-gluconate reductase A
MPRTSRRSTDWDLITSICTSCTSRSATSLVHGKSELYKEGKVKAIGVSNFSAAKLTNFVLTNQKVVGIDTVPLVNQIETNPFNQQVEARAVMEEFGVAHEGWAPFAEGYHDIFNNDVLSRIADNHGKSIGQVVLRWHIQRE